MTPEDHNPRLIHVVAAAVTDAGGRTLIAQRPEGKPLAGGWEFPGGKIEPRETRVQALTRELQEELGITLTGHPRPLIRIRHTYPYGEVLLDMWVVRRYSGEPRGMDGQAIRWCSQAELETAAELLPADRPVVRALRLPERLVARATADYTVAAVGEEFDPAKLRGLLSFTGDAAAVAVGSGAADFLVMRSPVPPPELACICASVYIPVFARGIGLEEAWPLGATGVSDVEVLRNLEDRDSGGA